MRMLVIEWISGVLQTCEGPGSETAISRGSFQNDAKVGSTLNVFMH